MENPMTNRIIPSTDCADYKRPTRLQAIAGCAGFAALTLAPWCVETALSVVSVPDAVVLGIAALIPVAVIVAAAKL